MLVARLGLSASISARGSSVARPSLGLNFLGGALDSRLTFTRASTAWAYNSAGTLTSYATNAPRFDYDPVTLAAKGLLLEEARTNLFAGDLTNTTNWSVGSTTRATGQTAPDGTTNGVLFTESASGTASYGPNSVVVTVTASTATTASIFVKAGTCSFLRLLLADTLTPTIAAQSWFNLNTGATGTNGVFAGAPTSISASITSVGSGWYRCTITATLSTATTACLLVRMTSADAATTDAGSKTVSLWCPQIEVGSFATSPIVTTTASATRAVDVCSAATSGFAFNAAEGTLFAAFTPLGVTGLQTAIYLDDGTNNERMGARASSGAMAGIVVDGGVSQASANAGTLTAVASKVAIAYKVDDIAICLNGGTVGTDALATIPTVTKLQIGSRLTGTEVLSGWYARAAYYSRRMDNSTLIRITA